MLCLDTHGDRAQPLDTPTPPPRPRRVYFHAIGRSPLPLLQNHVLGVRNSQPDRRRVGTLFFHSLRRLFVLGGGKAGTKFGTGSKHQHQQQQQRLQQQRHPPDRTKLNPKPSPTKPSQTKNDPTPYDTECTPERYFVSKGMRGQWSND